MSRADIIAAVTSNSALQFNGAGTSYVVQSVTNGLTNGTTYLFFVNGDSDLKLVISYNGGITWTNPLTVFTGTIVAFALWYERWSGINGDVIHLAYTESGGSDILYRQFNPLSETFGTQTTVFAGTSTAANGALSIVVGRDGRICVTGSIDAGAEDGAWSSTDDGATWTDTIADPSEGGANDQYFLLPGWNADTADLQLVFVDASADGLSLKRYDDSANTWTESAIIADGGFVDVAASSSFPHVAVVCDVSNSRNIVIAWSAVDTANADLRCFILTDTTITEVTEVILNSTDDQGLAALSIDITSGDWYAFYAGKTGGTETFSSSVKIYYKVSTDDGATWGSETTLSDFTRGTQWMTCAPRFESTYSFIPAFLSNLANYEILVSVVLPSGASAGGGSILGGSIIH